MYIIRSIINSKEIDICINKVLNNKAYIADSPVPLDDDYIRKWLYNSISRKDMIFRIIEKNNNIVGCILAIKGKPIPHSNINGISLLYYYTDLSGYTAVKCLILVHEYLKSEARKIKFNIVVSSSGLQTREVFNRILKKEGWQEYGCSLISYT